MLFSKKANIIVILKDKIIAVKVRVGKKCKLIKSFEYGWNNKTIDVVFSKIKSDLKLKKARILLSSDLSYVLRMKIANDTPAKQKREIIAQEINKNIPEVLADGQWDYKEIVFDGQQNSPEREIMVFSPVKEIYELINKAIESCGFEIEAIEPEEVAQIRDVNPVFGLAKKKDIKGKDETTLNIKFNQEEEEPDQNILLIDEAKKMSKQEAVSDISDSVSSTSQLNVKKTGKGRRIWAILFLFLFSFSGVFIYLYRSGIFAKIAGNFKPLNTHVLLPTATLIPTPTVFDVSSYSINILNGSGIEGEAAFAKELLENSRFSVDSVGNDRNYNKEYTSVSIKNNLPAELFNQIDKALDNYYELATESGLLEEENPFDVVITLSKRIDN